MQSSQSQLPTVSMVEVEKFSKVWNSGGISIILDGTAKKFALDFSNVVLRSFVIDQMQKVAAMQKALQDKEATAAAVPPPPVMTKGLIQLTDM